MDKKTWSIHRREYYAARKKEGPSDTCHNVGGPGPQDEMFSDISRVQTNTSCVNPAASHPYRQKVDGGAGGWALGGLLMGTELPFGKWQAGTSWRWMDGGDGCRTL